MDCKQSTRLFQFCRFSNLSDRITKYAGGMKKAGRKQTINQFQKSGGKNHEAHKKHDIQADSRKRGPLYFCK